MSKGLIVFCAAWMGFAATGFSEENPSPVAGTDAIAARQASLDMSTITFRSIRLAIKSGEEPKNLGYPAAALAKWAKALPKMFPAGTGQGETSVFSQAKPAIWKDQVGFERAAANYAETTAKLASLAAANDTAAFTKQLELVDQACAACHITFKAGDQTGPRK